MTDAPYQLLPDLTDDEYQALKDNIATFGVLHPVVVDEDGNIIDGHHRVRACDELGIDYPKTILPGLTEQQKLEQSLSFNLARRHLTPEQKQALVADLRERGLSIRVISEQTGIPKSTVHRYASAVPDGTPEYVTGEDGKRYRAVREPVTKKRDYVAEYLELEASAEAHEATAAFIERFGVRPDEAEALLAARNAGLGDDDDLRDALAKIDTRDRIEETEDEARTAISNAMYESIRKNEAQLEELERQIAPLYAKLVAEAGSFEAAAAAASEAGLEYTAEDDLRRLVGIARREVPS